MAALSTATPWEPAPNLTEPTVFGPAYAAMYANDLHAPGSVDRVIWDRMVLVCERTTAKLYEAPSSSAYRAGSRPGLEARVAFLPRVQENAEAFLDALGTWFAETAARDETPIDEAVFGGTEEQIVERVTDLVRRPRPGGVCFMPGSWPPGTTRHRRQHQSRLQRTRTDRSFPLRGMGSPLPHHRRDLPPQRGPASQCCRSAGRPGPGPSLAHQRGGAPYTFPEQFATAAIATYAVADADSYDYTTSGVNAYYRSILAQAAKGWPGGLRWLHGEDAHK